MHASRCFLPALALALASCGVPDPAPRQLLSFEVPEDRGPSGRDRYLPLGVGADWTYQTTDNASGRVGQSRSTIEALEDVGGSKGGTLAYRVRNLLMFGDSTVNWQEQLGKTVIRHRAQFIQSDGALRSEYVYQPHRVRLDESPERLVVGATWTEDHTAEVNGGAATATYSVTWTIEAIDEEVTVPAGTFSCLRLRRVQTGYSSSDETHWFARRVGKVKETGPETKELTSYWVP